MSLAFDYNGAPLTHGVKPSTISITTRAENGEAEFGTIPIEDPDASLDLVGHKPFLVEDDDCAQPRLFTGYVAQRDIGRSTERGLRGDEDQRLVEVSIVDCNAIAGFRPISGDDGNRPEETWDARLAWIMGSDYLDGLYGEDTTWIDAHDNPMDAADYRGGFPAAVLDDLVNRFEGAMNWFFAWNPDTSDVELAVFGIDDVTSSCTLSISNVLADVDGVSVFYADLGAKLAREPDQVFSEVVLEYSGGRTVFRSLESTATAHIRRGTKISRPYTGKESTAIAQADQFLQMHAFERDRITCVMKDVPAASVGLVRAGMSIDVTFTHMGYEGEYGGGVTMRIVACGPVPVSDVEGAFYDIALELVGGTPVGETITSQIGLAFTEEACPSGSKVYPRTCKFEHLGDAPPPGYDPYPTIGLLTSFACGDGYGGVTVLGDGTVDIEHKGAFAGVGSSSCAFVTVSIRVNGAVVETDTWTQTSCGFEGYSGDTYLLAEDVAVEYGDAIDVYVEIGNWSGDGPYYRRVGGSSSWNPGLKVWGDLTFVGGTGDPIPVPVHPTTTISDAPPTVDDDETLGFQVGDHWIDTDTGIEYVLVDNTDGAAVWVAVTNEMLDAAIEYVVDGGGSELTTGLKGFLEVPFACTITAARMLADQTGSAIVDVWVDDFAAFPPTNADSITAAAPPTISADVKSEDVTLTAWTTAIAAGDIVAFNIDSVSDITRLTISLTVTRT
jgi:hypothetical protein